MASTNSSPSISGICRSVTTRSNGSALPGGFSRSLCSASAPLDANRTSRIESLSRMPPTRQRSVARSSTTSTFGIFLPLDSEPPEGEVRQLNQSISLTTTVTTTTDLRTRPERPGPETPHIVRAGGRLYITRARSQNAGAAAQEIGSYGVAGPLTTNRFGDL